MTTEREVVFRVNLVPGDTGGIKAVTEAVGAQTKTIAQAAEEQAAAWDKAASAVEDQYEAVTKSTGAVVAQESAYAKAMKVLDDMAAAEKAAAEQAARLMSGLERAAAAASSVEEVIAVADKLAETFIRAEEAAGQAFEIEEVVDVINQTRETAISAWKEREAAAKNALEEEIRKQKEAEEAAAAAADKQRVLWAQSAASLTQSVTAASQFLTVMRLFAGEDEGLQAMAKEFVKIQATIQALAAGNRALSGFSKSLLSMAAAASTNAASSTAAGAAAAAATPPMFGFAGAAGAAGAALQTVAPVVAVITAAVAAGALIWEAFGSEAETAGDRAEEALRRAEEQTQRNIDAINRQRQAIEDATGAIYAQISAKQELAGGADSPELIGERRDAAIKKAESTLKTDVAKIIEEGKLKARGDIADATKAKEEFLGKNESRLKQLAGKRASAKLFGRTFEEKDELDALTNEFDKLHRRQTSAEKVLEALKKTSVRALASDGDLEKKDFFALPHDISAAIGAADAARDEAVLGAHTTAARGTRRHQEQLIAKRDRTEAQLASEKARANKELNDEEVRAASLNKFRGEREGRKFFSRLDLLDNDDGSQNLTGRRRDKFIQDSLTTLSPHLRSSERKELEDKAAAGTITEQDFRDSIEDASTVTAEEVEKLFESSTMLTDALAQLNRSILDMQKGVDETRQQLEQVAKTSEDATRRARQG